MTFLYSLFYVYYEQYLTMIEDALLNIGVALIPIFVISFFMLSFDFLSAFIIIITIVMVLVDTLGIMYLWGVDFNAISLVNLVMVSGLLKFDSTKWIFSMFKHTTESLAF